MSQTLKSFSTKELRALHGDEFLKIVTTTRFRIQKMDPRKVAKATDRTLRCVINFVSGMTRVPRASTLSAMLRHIVATDYVVIPTQHDRVRRVIRERRDLRKNRRHVRPTRRSVLRAQKCG